MELAIQAPPLPRLNAPAPRSGVVGPSRLALRQYLADYERDLSGAFHAGADVELLLKARTQAVERVLAYAWQAWIGDSDEAVLIAAGGFGRGELFPYSDVDLLVLTTAGPAPALTRAIEAFLACLWDIGISPGHAVRELEACLALASSEVSVYTNLVEARFLQGAHAIAERLFSRLQGESCWSAAAFVAAKRAEQQARHQRFGDTAYNLEPHLKDGPGGLRDLHMIGWLGRVVGVGGDDAAMLEAGLLDAAEVDALAAARATLFRFRYALHLLAGRAEERLLFDYQRDLAHQLGYRDEHGENLGVEQFMQAYFRAARRIAGANEELIARCTEMLAPTRDGIVVGPGFVRIGDRLDIVDPARLRTHPASLIELYGLLAVGDDIRGLRANAMREVRLALADPLLDLDHASVFAALRALLERGASAVDALVAMARHGVLARLIPGFARVTGRMQYDLFHAYTVDEHTLRVLQFMARFSRRAEAHEFALAHEVFMRLPHVSLLLLAGLFHDIAKGRGGDHSVLGEEDAREFCRRLQLADDDVELVAWLVRWHLLMSITAQRQDITDADVVHRFADQVGDWERLDYLYLLTVADINGTSPKLWNSWRDRLLSDLYAATRYVLREEAGAPAHASERVARTRVRAGQLLQSMGIEATEVQRIWEAFPQESFLRHRAEQIAWQTAAIAAEAPGATVVKVNPSGSRGTSEVFVHARERDGLFATVTAVLDRAGLDVVEARAIASPCGMVLDTFLVLDGGGHVLDPRRIARVERNLRTAISATTPRLQPAQRTLPRTLRHFQAMPQIGFSEDGERTRLALVCSDRPGLLASVAQTFLQCGLRVHDARIATFGERVEDFFQLTDKADRPLDAAAQQRLRIALHEQLDAPGTVIH